MLMKRLICLCLSIVLLLSVAACGGKSNGGSVDENLGDTSENTSTTNQNEPLGQPEDDQMGEEIAPADPDEGSGTPDVEENQPEEMPDNGTGEEPAVITISHTDVTFKAVGSSFKLIPQGVIGEYTVTYISEDAAVATVTSDGTVTAVAPGTTTVNMQVKQDGVLYDANCIIRCNWVEAAEGEEESMRSADLAAFFSGFMEGLGENAPFMMAVEGEILDVYYPGLGEYSASQSVIQMAGMSAVPFEFALIELENAADVEAVKAILQSRVDAQASGGAWYPETIAAWEKAEIIVTGSYVAMIVAGDQQAEAVAAYKALFD